MTNATWTALQSALRAKGHEVYRGNDNYFIVDGRVVSLGQYPNGLAPMPAHLLGDAT